MGTKTKVFKLDRLNKKDLESIHHWLYSLRWVWNEGLRMLLDLDAFTGVYTEVIEVDGKPKKTYHRAPCCPIPWQYRRLDKGQPWGDGNYAPYTYFAGKKPYAQFCRLPQDYREPKLDNSSYFSLCKYFAQKNHKDKPWLTSIPSNFVRGTCKSLSKSWDLWKAGKGGKPKFKSARFPLSTLLNEDAKKIEVTKISDRDGSIRIPKLGVFRVKHLWKDWGDREISVLKVAMQPDGYYLQLTGKFEDELIKDTERECSIAAPKGITPFLGVSDRGKQYKAYSPDPKLMLKKERLQQQLSRQQYLSGRWHKTKLKLGRVEELLSQQAKNHNQKLSTFLVRTYTKIELNGVDKRKVIRKPKRKEKAGTIDPIAFDPNGAEAVSQYNKNLLSQRSGQFVALVKQKARAMKREVKAK